MKEELISFETAVLAKEKGFTAFNDKFKSALIDSRNYDVQRYSFYRVIEKEQTLELNVGTNSSNINGLWESYNDVNFKTQKNYFAPTQSLLQRWLREVHNIEILINRIPPEAVLASKNNGKNILNNYSYYVWSLNNNPRIANKGSFKNTYEEALEKGLQEALTFINI